jgi:hypothetical protein
MSHASRAHRALDVAQAEALARDRERVDEAADRQRLAADRDADLAYRAALAASGDRFRDVADPGGALVPSKTRLRDARSLSVNRPRVLLTKLSVRTSAKGREYLSGWLGKASVVGFPGEADRFGNAVWDIFVSEPERPDDPWLRPETHQGIEGWEP